jgi:glutathione reductase (NADPH)
MSTKHYDVIVIGSGAAGGRIASRCHKAGRTVALIEHDGFGGTCPLRGCEPKKMMVDVIQTAERLHNSAGLGVVGQAHIDWQELMAFKRSFTDTISDKIEAIHAKNGVDIHKGRARFTGPNTVDTGSAILEGERICIATGAVPRTLDIPGGEHAVTSDDFLELAALPERIVFIGGGFIAFEMAHIAAAAGADVTIVHRSSRVLRPFDADLAQRLMDHMRSQGVTILTDLPPHSITAEDGGVVLHAGPGGAEHFPADLIVQAAGRIPATADLNLEAAGVATDKGAVTVDHSLRSTTNPAVFAAGDVITGGMPLTPVAAKEADTVIHNLLSNTPQAMEYGPIPYALFTYPPLAAVGLLEEQAAAQGRTVDIVTGDASGWSEYERIGQKCAGFKLIIDADNRQLLGAHVLGDAAEEMVNLFALAMRTKVSIDDLRSMLWAYPSFGYAMKYMFR